MSSDNNNNNSINNNDPSLTALAAARAALNNAAAAGSPVNSNNGNNGGVVDNNNNNNQQYYTTNGDAMSVSSSGAGGATNTPAATATTTTTTPAPSPKSQLNSTTNNSYPLPAYCRFVPGGIEYSPSSHYGANNHEGAIHLARHSNNNNNNNNIPSTAANNNHSNSNPSSSSSPLKSPQKNQKGKSKNGSFLAVDTTLACGIGGMDGSDHGGINGGGGGPEAIVRKALVADATLRKYALHYYREQQQQQQQQLNITKKNGGSSSNSINNIQQKQQQKQQQQQHTPPLPGQRLPSLSILAESALVNPLTGVPPSSAVLWAETMILEYMDGRFEQMCDWNGNTAGEVFAPPTMDGSTTANNNNINDKSSGKRNEEEDDIATNQAAQLIQRATLAAWTAEEASTGRTPTHFASFSASNTPIKTTTTTTSTSTTQDLPPNQAIHLPTPPLPTFLRSLFSIQQGIHPTSTADANHSNTYYTGGPCGYVFRRGDIAWNCRTCQTDATCVLCDACFRESNHEGHEVLFHRTTPGGCCDCGDREAWRVEGCCARHCPPIMAVEDENDEDVGDGIGGGRGSGIGGDGVTCGECKEEDNEAEGDDSEEDDFEAVRAAKRGRLEHERIVNGIPIPSPIATEDAKPLPPRLAAAMGVVIGAVIRSVLTASEGSAIGADVLQWRLKWADDICRVWNGVSVDEEYYRRFASLTGGVGGSCTVASSSSSPSSSLALSSTWTVPEHVLNADATTGNSTELPKKLSLFLRLHNDDVHTFDEVITALYGKPSDPIPIPICGRGSMGKIGGAGMSSADFKALSEQSSPKSDAADATMMDDISTTAGGVDQQPSSGSTTTQKSSLRHRSLSGDTDVPQRQQRRFRGDSSPPSSTAQRNSNSIGGHHATHQEIDPTSQLVPRAADAEELTRRVDADGQVLVREYETLDGAGIGFSRLRKSAGLHCSVLTTPRIDAEERAKVLLEWLSELLTAHPAVGAMIVQALVDVTEGEDVLCANKGSDDEQRALRGVSRGVAVWSNARMIPCWSGTHENWWGEGQHTPAWRRRLDVFPPHLESSYLSREEGRELYKQCLMGGWADRFVHETGTDPNFYANIPYSLPDSRLCKSPHALWGTLPSTHINPAASYTFTHPLLRRLSTSMVIEEGSSMIDDDKDSMVLLRSRVFLIDTDLRKYQEGEKLTASLFPHQMAGLNLVSGVGHVGENGSSGCRYGDASMGVTSKEDATRLASCSSYKAPVSPVLLLLLLDPYTPKLLRSSLHRLFLKLITDSRFKSRFAASLGAIVHRPTSTLFCAGIGTDVDTLLSFTVQLFTTGSLVKALGNLDATKALLCREDKVDETENSCISALPIAHSVVRSIHTNILGATREVARLSSGNDNDDEEIMIRGCESNYQKSSTSSILDERSSVYQSNSEHPLNKLLPAAPDDKFIDSRCMKHKRLPHLLRDLEYIFETPGTAVKLLRSNRSSSSILPATSGLEAMNDTITPSPSFSINRGIPNSLATYNIPNSLEFSSVWARLLRLGQGIDLHKRKVSGGHVEYEDDRWLGAYGLSLNLSGTGDALSESPFSTVSYNGDERAVSILLENAKSSTREAMGNLFAAFFREIKMWLYREGLLETEGRQENSRLEALQRSTLHVSISQLDEPSVNQISAATGVTVAESCDVACETGVKNLPETKLALLEAALLYERKKVRNADTSSQGLAMGDWLKVPHSPLAGDWFSFHLPLHRALARSIRCFCSAIVPIEERLQNPNIWWRLPLLDDGDDFSSNDTSSNSGLIFKHDSLSALVKPTHKSSNLRVMWSSGPECSTPEAQLRRSRSRLISTLLASTKVVHSLCDHPLRCIAAALQIDHHMWAKNGSSLAGMSLNYGSVPLCRSLRDLDLTMVQLSACGFNVGLGARRVFALLTNRFSMDGYLCDPDRRVPRNSYVRAGWVKPPRMQDPEHAELLAESFFTTLCVLVSDLPPPPPSSLNDDTVLRRNLRRELLHALAVEPRSHSEAMAAASAAVSRREESDGGAIGTGGGAASFRSIFTEVLQSIAQARNHGSRASSGPPLFELKPVSSNEYDPSFYHLRRTDHQHAMDNIARLRKQKLAALSKGTNSIMVLPLVAEPPQCHPRFLPCRLLLHLPPMYAAIRRSLMYSLFDGSWLPPSEPEPEKNSHVDGLGDDAMPVHSNPLSLVGGDSPAIARRDTYRRATSSMSNISSISATGTSDTRIFSPETVAASSKSFLEVLHILTLQVHTLEECSNLYKMLPFLDHEQTSLSSSISINSYLSQLVDVPNSLDNVWALLCAPDGPLPSKGSGENRGSVLGLLIALYEHRDQGDNDGGRQKSAHDDHGGARALSADGLKWLLRFVCALVDGAETVEMARQSATSGVMIISSLSADQARAAIHPDTCGKIKGMLVNLPELWPSENDNAQSEVGGSTSERTREARKAAQARALAEMKKKQASFAASISSQFNDDSEKKLVDDDEENLCIICKCDDDDGGNGPMGYLGHVQRSRVLQLSSKSVLGTTVSSSDLDLNKLYRVVGDKGCQLRSTESMDSAPVAFLPWGSIVEVLQSKISPQLGLLSRRVLVRQVKSETQNDSDQIAQGWASMQSWQGYVILSPLNSLCYTNTRWGATRPILRQCGHAAHLRCVEAHCLSLHQRSADQQPYDGRFSANIDDGEFLCPLCKQLSNILIPEDGYVDADGSSFPQDLSASQSTSMCEDKEGIEVLKNDTTLSADISMVRNILVRKAGVSYSDKLPKSDKDKATHQFGSNLLRAMQTSSVSVSVRGKKESEFWHPALRRWDFEDDFQGDDPETQIAPQIGSILRLMRQQLVSWAAVGHSAAAAEASGRGVRQVMFGEVSYAVVDPWSDFGTSSRDSHPMLLELRRSLTATSSLVDVVTYEIGKQLGNDNMKAKGETVSITGSLISDILEGRSWTLSSTDSKIESQWQIATALIASMMCHVSKEDTVASRIEARAVAAAMWAITGQLSRPTEGSATSMDLDTSPEVEVDNAGNIGNQELVDLVYNSGTIHAPPSHLLVPPKPLSIYRVERNLSTEIESSWGTLDPSKVESGDANVQPKVPFRPSVASAFLYIPILGWDLNTLAGGVFSCLLSNASADPCLSSHELLQSAKVLLIGRLIQVLSTPNGFLPSDTSTDEDDFDQDENVWDDAKKSKEAAAINDLLSLCQNLLPGTINLKDHNLDDASLLQSVGNAILPFARSLVLLLRASVSLIRQRQRRSMSGGSAGETNSDKFAANLLENSETMTIEDGLHLLEVIGAPLPSDIIKSDSSDSSWISVVKRWITSFAGFDAYHGTRGGGLTFDSSSKTWVPKVARHAISPKVSTNDNSSIRNLRVESSAAAVEVAQLNDNGELNRDEEPYEENFNGGNEEDLSSSESYVNEVMDIVDDLVVDSDEELEHVDMDVDLGGDDFDFEDNVRRDVLNAAVSMMMSSDIDLDIDDDASDVNSSLIEPDGSKILGPDDRNFSHVSRSAMIPFQPSILGNKVGPGPRGVRGELFEYKVANQVMSDLSHLGMIHLPGLPMRCLVKLPRSFVELYSIVNRVKGRDARTEDADDDGGFETAICLLTGAIMRSGSVRRMKANRPPGTCTLHARKVGSGIGIFFLVQKCTVLLMHNNKSAYSPSLYVDEHGEEDPGLRRGRPLFFSEERYHALENLWRTHGIPREVSQIRSTSDRVIRDNWY